MKSLTVPDGMYSVHSNYSVASTGYAGYTVHTTEYRVCTTKYTARTLFTLYTRVAFTVSKCKAHEILIHFCTLTCKSILATKQLSSYNSSNRQSITE